MATTPPSSNLRFNINAEFSQPKPSYITTTLIRPFPAGTPSTLTRSTRRRRTPRARTPSPTTTCPRSQSSSSPPQTSSASGKLLISDLRLHVSEMEPSINHVQKCIANLEPPSPVCNKDLFTVLNSRNLVFEIPPSRSGRQLWTDAFEGVLFYS